MKLILQFIKPYRRLLLLTLLAVMLDVAGGLILPTITANIINNGVGGGDLQYVLQGGILMITVAICTGAGALVGSYFSADLASKVGRDLRNALYDHSQAFSSYDFERFGTGSMITRTLSDVNIVQQSVIMCVQMILPVPVVCIMGIVMAFWIDRMMGFVLIGVTCFIILLAVLITRKASAIFGKLQSFLDRMNTVLRENATGVRVIRAFNKEQSEEERMHASFEQYAEASIQANRLFAGLESAAILAINLTIVAILWLGSGRVGSGAMAIGDITAVTEYAIMILFYVIMAQMVFIMMPRALICSRRIREVLDHQPEIADSGGARTDPSSREVVRFRDAGFRFPDAEENTLAGLDFACRRGETTAIIGSTGSGKSTIAKLILRFHDVTEGAVLFDGADIRQLPQSALRERIAYVPQKAWLFSGTIAENLRYGDSTAGEEKMRHVLRVAQSDFVEKLPDGLESRVAQGGTNFSGGQKQRLSIARALMKEADLYIFDDSFSALDFKTDAALRRALQQEVSQAAVLIIAQRVSTIQHADQIIVLENGRVAGIGTHDQLMTGCPVYREIAQSQAKGGSLHE